MQKLSRAALAWILTLAFADACAQAAAGVKPDERSRIQLDGFSIVSPPAGEWRGKKTAGGMVFLNVARSRRDHTLFLRAEPVDMGGEQVEAAEDIARHVEQQLRPSEDRFRTVEVETSLHSMHAASCVRFRAVFEERDNPIFPGVLLLENRAGILCRNPYSPRIGVMFAYSERRRGGTPSMVDDLLRRQIAEVTESIVFSPAR